MWNVPRMSNLPPLDQAVIPTAEVAKITGKSVATIHRWADTGRLPVAVKAPGIRGARFFRLEDVQQAKDDEQVAS